MKFEESYFEGEVRDDFYVKPMMKRAWAAQLEVLHEIDIICKRHNITYFAEWGTLLGAVRHHGFVPWDDDMDIGMTRPDYIRFLAVASKELPKGYMVDNVSKNPHWNELLTRVTNSAEIRTDDEFLSKFHGCPYVVGIDIFPNDYIPKSKEEEEIQLKLLASANILGRNWDLEGEADPTEMTREEKLEALEQLKELCNVKFNDELTVKQQLLVLSDRIASMYWDIDADEITQLHMLANNCNYRLPISCYSSMIDMPFENTTIPVPVGYDQILTLRYGDYMTPVKVWNTHSYPFYKEQEKILIKFCTCTGIEIPMRFIDFPIEELIEDPDDGKEK